jgi:hypothetical protein
MQQAKWTGWFKVVDPVPQLTKMTDNMSMDSSQYTNHNWYQNVISGSSTRISRYNEYDQMDNDVDVSRALDLVAEEMTNQNLTTTLPLNLNLSSDLTTQVPQNIVSTLRVCLKHWCTQRGFSTRMHGIARHLIKYGDMLFERKIDERTKAETWEYINIKNVIGAIVDKRDATKVLGWQIRKDTKVPRESMGGMVTTSQTYETEVLPCEDIVRFTLNDDLSDEAPFGLSVLNKVFRVTKQKELLEASIVIYRVQRAPERRVFYIDVGKMQPQRTKQYLESIKNEIKQKKVPSVNGMQSNVDSAYNPQGMNEDFFFAQRPDGGGSRVETLPAGQNLGELSDLEYFRQQVLQGLRIPPSYLPNFQLQDNISFSDGQVGVAYMAEIQFFKYVTRLQSHINATIDVEFKKFLRKININIDPSLFTITVPMPTNFEKYKEAAVDGVLLSQFGNADGIPYLSKRFILSRYLKLSSAELSLNETMLAQERGLNEKESKSVIALYNPDSMSTNDVGDDNFGGGTSPLSNDMGDGPTSMNPPPLEDEQDQGEAVPEKDSDNEFDTTQPKKDTIGKQ